MKKYLTIIILGFFWATNLLADAKIIFLECKSDYSVNLKSGETGPTAGKFTFRIKKLSEPKNDSALIILSATKSDGIVRSFHGSSSDDTYSLLGASGLEISNGIQIESIKVNRINGQLINHTQIFKNAILAAELIHYSNCKVSKPKF